MVSICACVCVCFTTIKHGNCALEQGMREIFGLKAERISGRLTKFAQESAV